MPGHPRYHAFVEQLELRAYSEGHEHALDYVLERIGNGEALRTIAQDVGGMSRWTLWKWITADDTRYREYREARKAGAGALVEEAQHILDTADTSSPAAVMSARNRAGFRQWQAAMQNRREYGKETAHTINQINIGSLHLDTLRKLGGPESQAPRALPEPIDAEIIEEPTE